MTIAMHKPSGLFYRPKRDDVILGEFQGVYGELPVKPGDVMLDLGAHIGAASRVALDRGARVVAVEADPDSLRLLRRNLAHLNARVIGAAVGPTRGMATLYTRGDRPHLSTTLAPDKGRKAIRVPMVAFGDLLEQYQPTIVKCDIEFSEYALPELRALPEHVRVLALEVHIRYDLVFSDRMQTPDELRGQRAQAAGLISAIEAQGFREVRRKNKLAKGGPKIDDETGLPQLCKSVDAIWAR